ncbi:MAG: hypothetical protein ABIL06_16175 [Pseudomonadota bacterium]
MKKLQTPHRDPETGEWRYAGRWWDEYPTEEVEKDEAAYDEHCDREFRRQREDERR